MRGDDDTTLVLRFGTTGHRIDAYTLSNALISLSDTARAINRVVNPEQSLDLWIEAFEEGSFKVRIRKASRGLEGLFSKTHVHGFIWTVLASAIVLLIDDQDINIVVQDDAVVTVHRDKIIIEHVEGAARNAIRDEAVKKGIRQTFETLDADTEIKSLDLLDGESEGPLLHIPRDRFAILAGTPQIDFGPGWQRRERREKARVLVTKAWLKRGRHKWQFEWNGVPISAPVDDERFLTKLERREYKVGQGDVFDVIISYLQDFRSDRKVWENDPTSYRITDVVSIPPPEELPF